MKKGFVVTLAILLGVPVLSVSAGCTCIPNDPLGGKIYTATPTTETGEKPSTAFTIPNPTATPSAPSQSKTQEQTRYITVNNTNSEFTIGLPPGYTEEREITASKPVDVWFQYITPEMSLTVNGDTVQIPVRRSTSKLGLTQGVTHLKYVLKSLSQTYQSYSLRILPSTQSGDVQVTTKEKWIAP